jgi:hypothetical protein
VGLGAFGNCCKGIDGDFELKLYYFSKNPPQKFPSIPLCFEVFLFPISFLFLEAMMPFSPFLKLFLSNLTCLTEIRYIIAESCGRNRRSGMNCSRCADFEFELACGRKGRKRGQAAECVSELSISYEH